MNSSSPTFLSFLLLPSVMWQLHGAIDFEENLHKFSVGSFKAVIDGKLLRFNDDY